jgi:hypothetical protein
LVHVLGTVKLRLSVCKTGDHSLRQGCFFNAFFLFSVLAIEEEKKSPMGK